jgi:hypothetical protein
MSYLSLPTSTSAGRPESRICLVKSKYTDLVEAPWPPVVSSAKGDKIDPVAAQMRSYLAFLALLCLLCAGQDVIAGIVFLWARLLYRESMARVSTKSTKQNISMTVKEFRSHLREEWGLPLKA